MLFCVVSALNNLIGLRPVAQQALHLALRQAQHSRSPLRPWQ
jgi:hypothetical protein